MENIEENKTVDFSNLSKESKEEVLDKTDIALDIEQKEDSNINYDNSDIFITEDDTFEVVIRYHRDQNNSLVVETVNNDFNETTEGLKTFSVTFKYPSQGDYENIINAGQNRSVEQLRYADIVQMENFRIALLIRSWTLPHEIARIAELDPDIVKAIVNRVREKIALKGIL